jgi:hypothetical protein
MLVARQRFLAYGLAPLLYNAGIVAGTLLLGGAIGIYAAAVGTVLGAMLHLAVRAWGIRRTDLRLAPSIAVRSAAFREFVRLSIPKMVSQPIEPLTFLLFTSIASTLAAGSVISLSFARNFASVPVSLIGIAFSVAAFRAFGAAAADDRAGFTRLLRTNLVVIADVTTAAAIVLYLVSGLAIDLFLGGEAFDEEDVERTSLALGLFALAVPLESLTHLLARAVYATRNTILPVLASIAGLIATVGVAAALAPWLGISALPLAFAAGQGLKVVLLGVAVAAATEWARRARLDSRSGLSGRRRGTAHRGPGIAVGALPGQVVALHLGRVLERARRVGGTPDRAHPRIPRVVDIRSHHGRVREDERVRVGAVTGHDPGVGAAPGDEHDRLPRLGQRDGGTAKRVGARLVGADLVAART